MNAPIIAAMEPSKEYAAAVAKAAKGVKIAHNTRWWYARSISVRRGEYDHVCAEFVLRGTEHRVACQNHTEPCDARCEAGRTNRVVNYLVPAEGNQRTGCADSDPRSYLAIATIVNSGLDPAGFEGMVLG